MDIVTYVLLKKKINGVVSGITGYEIDGQTLRMTTSDGQTLEMTFPTPKDGTSIIDVKINESNHLICTLSDDTEVDAGEIKTVQGPKGEPFKYEDFTPEQLEALTGPAGKDGEDGYTPQKGVDYFTQEDIDEVVNDMYLDEYLKIEDANKTYATKEEIPDTKDFVTKETADETYAKKNEIPNLEDYYTKEETDDAIAEAITGGTVDLKDYLKKTEAEDTYAKKDNVYTKQEIEDKHYLTEHQDLSAYATNAGVDNKLENYYDKTASDEKYVDKDYTYSKAQVDEKIAEAASGGEISLDGYLKTEDADKKYATKDSLGNYVEKRVVGDKGVAVVSNDPTGGIMKFTSNTGEEMGVAVNDGSEGIYTQMYAKDAETGAGTRLTLDKKHAYVRTGNDHTFSDNDIIITKKDLPNTDEFITEAEVDTKLEDYETTAHAAETYASKNDIPSLDGYLTEAAADNKYASKDTLENYVDKATADETYAKIEDVYSKTDADDKFVTNTAMNSALENKVDKEEGKQLSQENFTTELKDKLDNLENADLTNYYNKQEVDAKIPDVSNFITKATASLENYYLKTETYTQAEIDEKIAAIETLSFEVVGVLPEEDIKTNKIYLLLLEKQGEQNKYGEYIYVEEAWEQIGVLTSDLDLDELKAEVALKANAADVYSKDEADQTFAKTEDIPTTLPNPHTLTLKFNGEDFVVYDGSADVDKDIVIDVAEIPGLDEEIERLIAQHGTTEGFQPFVNGSSVWELEPAAYKISGNNQTIRFTNEERETITNGAYMFVTSDEIYKYYILYKNNDTNFVIEYGRVNSDGSEGSHQVFSTQTLIDLTQVVESTTLEII